LFWGAQAIIHQGPERIIGGRRVANKDKIFSLYEPDVHVIVRGEAEAEVKFGNCQYLAEQADGLIAGGRITSGGKLFRCLGLPLLKNGHHEVLDTVWLT